MRVQNLRAVQERGPGRVALGRKPAGFRLKKKLLLTGFRLKKKTPTYTQETSTDILVSAMTDEDIIRNTVSRYSHCLDDRRFKEWSETFTEAGVFGARHGRAAIYENILN